MPWAASAAIVGAGISANSANKASQTQAAGGRKAIAEQQREFNLGRSDFAPYKEAGAQALQKLQALLGIQGTSPSAPNQSSFLIRDHSLDKSRGSTGPLAHLDPGAALGVKEGILPDKGGLFYKTGVKKGYRFDQAGYDAAVQKYNDDLAKYNNYDQKKAAADVLGNDTVYQSGLQFGLDQGTRGINARALAPGSSGYDSGATLKALTRFGNDYASTKVGDVANRLSALAGTGQAAVGSTAGLGTNTATNVGNIYTGLANAQGASQIAQGNAYSGALNNLGSQYWLSKLTGGGQRTTTPSTGSGNYFSPSLTYDQPTNYFGNP